MTPPINIYCTLRTTPEPNFPHILVGRRDHSDPELAHHLAGFINYVQSRRGGQMTQALFHVILHLQHVQQQYSMHIDEAHLADCSRWAKLTGGIYFTPDGAVRDPEWRILVDAEGESDPDAQIPSPTDAIERKARTEQRLTGSGILTAVNLPPVIGVQEVNLRAASDVALRSLALFVPAVRAESLNENDPIPTADLESQFPIGFEALTPKERAFMLTNVPARQAVINFAWRYETLAVLQWALNLSDDLPWPAQICDVPQAARLAVDNNNLDFVKNAALRPTEQILDALDLHYRLHWAVRQARLKLQEPPSHVDSGVVSERHHALNWLVRYGNDDWDDVATPT